MEMPHKYDPSLSMFTSQDRTEAIPVIIQTEHAVIMGAIHVTPMVRVLDKLINPEKFIAVTDAVIYDKWGDVRLRTNFLALNKEQIEYIIPRNEIIGNVEGDQPESLVTEFFKNRD
jgi:hypothetical protein